MNKFRVHVESVSEYYIELEANDEEHAKEIASGLDGDCFTEIDGASTWDITTADKIIDEDKLHKQAKELLDEIGETCSLDEVNKDNHPLEVRQKIDQLLKEFE